MTALASTTTAELQAMRKRLEQQIRSAEGIAKAFKRARDLYATKEWADRVSGLCAELEQVRYELTSRGTTLGGWLDKRDLPWVVPMVLCFVIMGIVEVLG
ncbi:hypothetical protein SOM08_06060 [Hydrogenophaga sp. SNF1]|jgi:hypothetical protein|uniref:hypothetical protein n=1 Tax=Hydrogenophaga sp. SNF1 TaxID=3098762 RepID=UPI002ACC2561|nr:hypothetical protein [Hydrogenophaga sp. SNF1]WQB84875.1 hypothetical protein SOM08_06060 [Hydrogenophaga sp. SNF1]